MDAKPEARTEGGVLNHTQHQALDRAAHLVPIVHYHAVKHNGDYRPYNSVDDLKLFYIAVFLVVLVAVKQCLL